MEKIRTRYAPSPTGNSHIGGARSALFNYLLAKHFGGDFIFRSEDTDIERNIEGGEESQLDNLRWLGIIPDEAPDIGGAYGPYRQMERLAIYKKYTDELLEKGYAYKCFCTVEELEKEREIATENKVMPKYSGKCGHLSTEEIEELEKRGVPYSIRLRIPENKVYEFEDLVRGHVSFESSDIGDYVIVKSNGIPTYNYAVVIDDHLMEITHVFRGEEHLSNTPKQIALYDYFGWKVPQFGHMTIVVNENRKKLSKRDESIIQFISQYKEMGYLPEAMFNFLVLLGWSPVGEEEIFTKEELIEIFDYKRLSKSPSVFDVNKLTWVNNRYIKATKLEDIVELCLPYLTESYDITKKSQEWLTNLIALFHDQMSYGKEIVELAKIFFEELEMTQEIKEILSKETVNLVLKTFKEELEKTEEFTVDIVKQAIVNTQKLTSCKGKDLYMPIRAAITHCAHGPDLTRTLVLIGKDVMVERINKVLRSERG